MIYLDSGATSLHKPAAVLRSVRQAMHTCASPGRGGYPAAMAASRQVYACREAAGALFDCLPEQVVITSNCTHGLNIAIRSLVRPGDRVLISGFEHNAVTRPLHALRAQVEIAGRRLFDWEDTLRDFRRCLDQKPQAAVFTHVSNVFGYILPVEEMASLCREREIPFIIDAAQSAGILPLSLRLLGADFIAMPGHKGLLGPQGTGLLLCAGDTMPLLYGGTGGDSRNPAMPEDLPERLEAGTMNVPGIAGLTAALRYLDSRTMADIRRREHHCARLAARYLRTAGCRVFAGDHQAGTVSFIPGMDCEEAAELLAGQGICVRAGLHCAPLAHESVGTLDTGTVRVSFGFDAQPVQAKALLRAMSKLSSSGR